jgi:hypothetical protein
MTLAQATVNALPKDRGGRDTAADVGESRTSKRSWAWRWSASAASTLDQRRCLAQWSHPQSRPRTGRRAFRQRPQCRQRHPGRSARHAHSGRVDVLTASVAGLLRSHQTRLRARRLRSSSCGRAVEYATDPCQLRVPGDVPSGIRRSPPRRSTIAATSARAGLRKPGRAYSYLAAARRADDKIGDRGRRGFYVAPWTLPMHPDMKVGVLEHHAVARRASRRLRRRRRAYGMGLGS